MNAFFPLVWCFSLYNNAIVDDSTTRFFIERENKSINQQVRKVLFWREIKFNSDQIRSGLRNLNIPFIENDSHIIPILIKDPVLCKDAANLLVEKHGIYIQPVFFPTVPKGDERFRVTITPKHNAQDIQNFLNAIDDVWSEMSLERVEADSKVVNLK